MSEEKEFNIESIKEELENLRVQNKTKNQQLASQNGQISPLGVVMTRFELFLEMTLTEEQKIVFEYSFEKEMAEQLDAALSEISRSKLLAPPTGPFMPR